MRYKLGGTVVILSLVFGALRADPDGPAEKRAGKLVQQLGSSRYTEREQARRELERLGAPALPALRRAVKSPDLETSRRAAEIVRVIEEKMTIARLLAPKRLRLKLQNADVLQAVAELEKASGYRIQVQGNVPDRKITLDTGETSFWQALDRLCVKSGLAEQVQGASAAGARAPKSANGVELVLQLPLAPAVQIVQAPLVQGPQPLPMFRQPGFGGAVQFATPPSQETITLVAGNTPPPTCYAGAVRLRLVSVRPEDAGQVTLTLDAAAEPRLGNFALEGKPALDRITDDQNQKLTALVGSGSENSPPGQTMWAGNPPLITRQSKIRVKLGQQDARLLKELSGGITAHALTPLEPLIVVDEVRKASGKTVKGADGGSIQLQSIEQTSDGDYQLRVRLENVPGPNPVGLMMLGGGAIQFQQKMQVRMGKARRNLIFNSMAPNVNQLTLTDKSGKPYRLTATPTMHTNLVNGQMTQEATLIFHADAGQGPPDRLAYEGRRLVIFPLTFTFRDVPLQ